MKNNNKSTSSFMGRLICVVVVLALCCTTFVSSNEPAIESSKVIQMSMLSNWDNTPLYLEASEFLQEQDSLLFWNFIGEYGNHVTGKSNEKEQYEGIFKTLDIITSDLSDAKKTLLKDMLSIRLSLRYYTAKVETMRQVVKNKLNGDELVSGVIQYNSKFLTDITMVPLEMSINNLKQDPNQKEISMDSYQFDHQYPGNINPVQMVDGVKKEIPTIVLYSDILSEHFKTCHNTLKYLARFGKIRYIFRYIVPDSNDKVHLQGFGFDLAIKNLEYKVMDDSAIKKDIKQDGESKTVVTIPDEDVKGFNFHKLQKRKPELTSKLSTFRSYLMAKSQENAELKVWEMKDLGTQTAQKISSSMDPLRSLKYINQNFPSIVQSLARTTVNETLKATLESVQKTIASTETMFLLNGLQIDIDTLNPIELSKILLKEFECTSAIQGLGVSPSAVQKMISVSAESVPLRFNILPDKDESNVFTFMNNLQTDYTYTSKWTKSVSALGQVVGKPDDLYVAKNLMTTVFVLDMSDDSTFTILSEIQNMVHSLVPSRFAIVLKTTPRDNAPVEASNPADIAKVFMALRKSSLGNRGAMFFFSALGYFKRVYNPTGPITINTIHNAFQAVVNQMGGTVRNLQQVLASTEYDEMLHQSNQYIERLGLASLPQVFLNGRLLPGQGKEITSTLPMALFDEFEQLKPLYKAGDISDSTQDYFQAILSSKHWSETGNPLLEQFSLEIAQAGVNQQYQRLSSATNSHTREKESSNILKDLVYFNHPDANKEEELVSVIVAGDYDQTKTQQIALALLKKVVASPESKTRVALLPMAIDQLPSSHSIGKLLSVAKHYRKQLVVSEVIRILEAAIASGKKWSGIQSIIQDLDIKIPRNDVWVSQSDNVFSLSSSIAKNYLGVAASLEQPVHLLMNGRLVKPAFKDASTYVSGSFAILEKIESLKAKPIRDILSQDGKKENVSGLLSNIRSLLGHYVDSDQTRTKIPKSIPISFTHSPKGHENTPVRMTLLVNPLSKVAQSLVPIVQKFSDKMKIAVDVILNPPTQISDMPMKNYYSYVINLDSEFDKTTGEFVSVPEGFITGLPESRVLTLAIDVPSSWLVQPIVAKYDLDNIRLKDLGEESVLEAVFELENIVIEGSCTDVYGQPPAGLEIVLQPVATKSRVPQDTIVMSNLGYYQLKSNPGLWRLEIDQGRSSEIMSIFDIHTAKSIQYTEISVDSLYQGIRKLFVARKPGQEGKPILAPIGEKSKKAAAEAEKEKAKESDGFFSGLFGGNKKDNDKQDAVAKKEKKETIHIFSVASGHLYERFLKIMMLSVIKNTESPVKFWFLKNYLSPNFKEFIPKMAAEYGFEYELVTYKWPWWLRKQTEKQRIIWSYKILFLDVLFPLNIPKIIFVDADQVVRADMKELWDMDLHGASLGYTPFCDSNTDTEGFRFWKSGYWRDHLRGRPYHISALYVVDLERFRKLSAGDQLRSTYDQLSRDANSLANLDQDLPNYLQHNVRIHSLPQEWLWCETWCDQKSKTKAKTIDLCNNPLTKTPKLENAVRIIDEWTSLDNEAKQLSDKFEPIIEREQAEIINQDEPKKIKNNEYIDDILGTINDAQKDLF